VQHELQTFCILQIKNRCQRDHIVVTNARDFWNVCAHEACPKAGNFSLKFVCFFSAGSTFSPGLATTQTSNETCVPYVDPNISTGGNLPFYQVFSVLA